MNAQMPAFTRHTEQFPGPATGFVARWPTQTANPDDSQFRPRTLVVQPDPPRGPETLAEPDRPSADPTPPPAPEAPVAPLPDAAVLEAARAEGVAKGRADAEADFAAARAAFDAALEVLSDPSPLAEGLITAIEDAVLRLASERAGYAIEASPQPFMDRIASLADRVAACATDIRLGLHPDDLDALQPYLAEHPLEKANFTADASLSRGDIRLKTANLGVDDLLQKVSP